MYSNANLDGWFIILSFMQSPDNCLANTSCCYNFVAYPFQIVEHNTWRILWNVFFTTKKEK